MLIDLISCGSESNEFKMADVTIKIIVRQISRG